MFLLSAGASVLALLLASISALAVFSFIAAGNLAVIIIIIICYVSHTPFALYFYTHVHAPIVFKYAGVEMLSNCHIRPSDKGHQQ